MNATALNPSTNSGRSVPTPKKVTLGRVVNSEWIKFRTLRSSWYTLLTAIAAMIGIGLVIAYTTSTGDASTIEAEDAAASGPLRGYLFAQLLIGVLGVLLVTGEYATGMIRSTFAAVPRRLTVLGAKTGVFAAVGLVAMVLASFAAFLGGQLFLSAEQGASLSDPGVLRIVAGTGVYLSLIGLLGGAFGWILRSTAGGIGALVATVMVIPLIFQFVPGSLSSSIAKYLPSSAGESFMTSVPIEGALAPWTGLGVLVLWVVAALAVAAVLVRRRDA